MAAPTYDRMSDRASKPVPVHSQFALLVGFGLVLALMAAAGVDAIRAVAQIQSSNLEITHSFLDRNRALERIRASLYLSGTYVRDYLLDPNPPAAEIHLSNLKKLREEMDQALEIYSRKMGPQEQAPFSELTRALAGYWETVNPVLSWDASQRKSRGYVFLTTDIFPRRAQVLKIADSIGDVNEKQLRSGGDRSAEVFDEFRRGLITMLTITLGLGLIVAGWTIVHILKLERDARLRYQEIVRGQTELENLSARLVDAQELERRSISRELHDEVGQSLTALLVDVGNAAAITPAQNEELHRRLQSIKKLAEGSVSAVRNMALLLRPSMLDDFGLEPSLHWQAREVSRRTGMRVDVDAEGVADELPEAHKTCLYRLVQEALNNCARHAQASTARVVVRQEPERLVLVVQDDGKGFDFRQVRGLGLLGMEERAKHLGGRFHVESAPGRGTRIEIELPLAGSSAPLASAKA
ncbi:MAG TPA: ATP-binding protein [Bryobacteraceae bacterium]|jgi:signal transduction histidine kinase|nr:ATP-binding protein [Bryobacteraceae bacterium]